MLFLFLLVVLNLLPAISLHPGICDVLKKSLDDDSFHSLKLTIPKVKSHHKADASEASNVFTNNLKEINGRRIQLKKGSRVQLNFKYERQHKQKNVEIPLLALTLQTTIEELDGRFEKFTVMTTEGDFTVVPGATKVKKTKSRFKKAPPLVSHDVPKRRMNDPGSSFFQKLGVTDKDGKPVPRMASKLRQCDKFVEIVGRLVLKDERSSKGVNVLDMGCGKGYLTFSLHNFLANHLSPDLVRSTGVELRPQLVDDVNKIVDDLGGKFRTLNFAVGEIGKYEDDKGGDGGGISALIALHACDTATDDAIFQGIKNKADIIVLSPCCHKEVRRYMETTVGDDAHPYKKLLRFGVYRERLAESVTDTMRGMLLEEMGYNVDIFEFIGGEHTAKNCMLTATRSARASKDIGALRMESKGMTELKALANMHGIKRTKLADLLGVQLGDTKGGLRAGRMPPKQ